MRKDQDSGLPELFTKSDLAKYFKVSSRTIERMFSAGLVTVKIRNKRYVSKKDLASFLKANGALWS